MIARRWLGAFGAAAALAVAMPLVLLPPGPAPRPAPAEAASPVAAAAPPPLDAAFERSLFAAAPGGAAAPLPEDAPQLVGIVGRIDRDAVALVRSGEATRTLAVGESIDGWRLESLAIDAASFARGNQRVRVPLPAGE